MLQRLRQLYQLRDRAYAMKAKAEWERHPSDPHRADRAKQAHNKAAAEFNTLRYFWMRRIENI